MDEIELRSDDSLKQAAIKLLSTEPGFNPRKHIELSEAFLGSIEARGILVPLLVRKNPKIPGHYYIVDGDKRFSAAKKLGLKEVPVILLEGGETEDGTLPDAEALLSALIANEHETLSKIEKAQALNKLKKSYGISEKDLATALGVSKRTLKETMVVLDSNSKELQQAIATDVESEHVPVRVAARATSLPEEEREEVVPKLKGKTTEEGLSIVRQAEAKIGKKNRGKPPEIEPEGFKVFPWATDAKKRAERLYERVMAHLTKNPNDERALAHLEMLFVLQGDREVDELYLPGEGPKVIATSIKQTQKNSAKKPETANEESPKTQKKAVATQKKRVVKKKTTSPKRKVDKVG